jgi:mitochondrial fission protein ELM1
MLALADHIVVTGDSISMCSEACTTGKPTYIYAPDNYLSKKHQIFVDQLFKSKRAHPLSSHADSTEYTPLNDASHVAEKIKELFLTT